MPEPDPPTFTLAQVRAMLPRVDLQLAAMQAARAQAIEAHGLVESARRSATGNGGSAHADTRAVDERLRQRVDQLRTLAAEMESMGVQVKDLDRGLVDWRAQREGRTVLLCWLRREADVSWWHELADGFAGRQAIVEQEWD